MSTENIIILLLIITIILVLIFIGVLTYLGLRFLKLQEQRKTIAKAFPAKNQNEVSQELLKSLRANSNEVISNSICIDHPEELSLGNCAISGEPYCKSCIIKHDETWVAKKHLDTLIQSEWVEVCNFEQADDKHDLTERVRNVKATLWQNKQIPLLIQGNFKINVHDDNIHSFLIIKARVEDMDIVKKELSFIKFIS